MAKKTIIKYLNLKQLRDRFGLNQTEMARIIGCSVGNYNGKENGRYQWSLSECVAIQEHFNEKITKAGEAPLTLDYIFLPSECQI